MFALILLRSTSVYRWHNEGSALVRSSAVLFLQAEEQIPVPACSRHTLRSDYQRQYEPILYGWREGANRFWCGARNQGDVWSFAKPAVNDLHPTMKPVALIEQVAMSTKFGSTLPANVGPTWV